MRIVFDQRFFVLSQLTHRVNHLLQKLPQYKGRWVYSMSDQIKDLPDYEKVEREVMRHLKKLEHK